MRVIAGTARGRELAAPKGYATRPVTAKIRESLFNIWQFDIAGSRFLDLFAGSGSMGVEALSRGASRVVFVDMGKEAVECIRRNTAACGFRTGYEVRQEDVISAISRLRSSGERFDFIYLDPPFTKKELFLPCLEALSDGKLLSGDGIISIRAERRMELPDSIGAITEYREKTYGISTVHFYNVRGTE